MISEKKTAIITCIDERFDENLENDFLKTLETKAHYSGSIFVLDYGIKSEVKKRISDKYNVNFYTFEKTRPVFTLRYKHIPTVLENIPSQIENIMLIDGGDVWFQKPINPIFEKTKDVIGCVEEPIIFGEDEWISLCMKNLDNKFKDMIFSNSKGKRNKNAGMICGPKDKVYTLINNIYSDMIDTGIEFFGMDQLFFNYEMNKLTEDDYIILEDEYNYILVTNKDFIYQNQRVYTKDHQMVTVVHNAGANWRIFNRRYGNIKKEEEQYMCNIIRKW